MKTVYRFVDAEGDEIDMKNINPGFEIPVQVVSVVLGMDYYVKLVGDNEIPVQEPQLIMTLRYLHDE